MSYVTKAQAVSAAHARGMIGEVAKREMRKNAHAPAIGRYDIFLSHAYEDAEVIAGIKVMLEADGLSVYVDWLDDPQADRSQVTPATAEMLRERMRMSRFLLFVSSKASPNSRWMPWELGYFDGFRPDRVGVLPVVDSTSAGFRGQEYLGLYPTYELVDLITGRQFIRSDRTATLRTAAA
jgi:hypothetical protein